MQYGFMGFQEVLDKAKTTTLPRYLPIFNKVVILKIGFNNIWIKNFIKTLIQNGSNGNLVGSNISLADIGLLEVLLTIEELLGEDELKPYPEILVNTNFNYSLIFSVGHFFWVDSKKNSIKSKKMNNRKSAIWIIKKIKKQYFVQLSACLNLIILLFQNAFEYIKSSSYICKRTIIQKFIFMELTSIIWF